MKWFIAGTDTGVGKTYVTSLLLKAAIAAGMTAAPYKPFCCGERDDIYKLRAACRLSVTSDEINPIWMRPPAAPYTAAMIEERPIDMEQIWTGFRTLKEKFQCVLVEGVGGWKVPITRDYTTADMAVEFGLPVVLVVHNRLGAINHTLLTLESIRNHGLTCAGLIMNRFGEIEDIPKATNAAILEDVAGLPILFDIEEGQKSITLAVA